MNTQWTQMRGGITRDGAHTLFSLQVSDGGHVSGQTISVETARLERVPGLYKRTLDLMVRDIQARL